MSRRIILRTAAALLVGVLVAGCVKQPLPEGALEADEDLGVIAAPLSKKEARRLARAAKAEAAAGEQASDADGGQRNGKRRRGQDDSNAGDAAAGVSGSGQQTASGNGTAPRPGGTAPRPAQPVDAGRPRTFRMVADIPDAPGDARGEAPGYADITRVLVESDGRVVRVSVAFAQALPGVLEEGEVQGVGIDFHRSDRRESDFQLFADGGSRGWEAFLHTPDGIVGYPGAFRLGGRVLVFEVPWRALGGAKTATVSAFVDWAKQRTLPLAAAGGDRAPNQGRVTVRP